MPLFDLDRALSRESDLRAAKKAAPKSHSPKKAAAALGAIDEVNARIREKLGKYEGSYRLFLAGDEAEFGRFVEACERNGIVAIDTETDGLNHFSNQIAGFSAYTPGQPACYVPLNHVSYYTKQRVPGQMGMGVAKGYLARLSRLKTVWHNAKFDMEEFQTKFGVWFKPYWDTFVGAYILDENGTHHLKDLYVQCVKPEDEIFSFGGLFDKMPFTEVPMETGYIYAAHDAEMTYQLYLWQRERLADDPKKYGYSGLSNVFLNIEMPLVPAIAEMELRGVTIDKAYAAGLSAEYNDSLRQAQERYKAQLAPYQSKIDKYAKEHPGRLSNPLNYASPTQLAVLLYDILKLPPVDPKKPRGTGEEILEKINLPICKCILECRGYEKLIGTYIDKLPNCVDPKTNALHCSFNQCGTDTGRLSSSDPNLQNIPSHDKKIRKMFTARPGMVLVGSDYSQQEPHILAQVSGDANLARAYDEGKDVYAEMAGLALGKPYENFLEFNPDGTENVEGHRVRSQFKTILLGIMYGRGAASIAEQLGETKAEAQRIINSFYKAFPRVKGFIDGVQRFAAENGYVETLWGRRRRLPAMMLPMYGVRAMDGYARDFDPLNFDSELGGGLTKAEISKWQSRMASAYGIRKRDVIEEAKARGVEITDNSMKVEDAQRQCANSVIQGSAADMTKTAMVMAYNDPELKALGFHILINVHDEIIGECPEENARAAAAGLRRVMVAACSQKVACRMKTDVEVTRVWTGEEVFHVAKE